MSNEIKVQIWHSRDMVQDVWYTLSNEIGDRVDYRVHIRALNNIRKKVVGRFSPVVVNTSRNSFDKAK